MNYTTRVISMGYAIWNQELLLAALLVVVAGMGLVSARSSRDRLLAIGVLAQATLIVFVANGTFHGRNELSFGGLVLLAVIGLWSVLGAESSRQGEPSRQSLDSIPPDQPVAEE